MKMEKISKLLIMLLMGASAAGFTACSSDSEETSGTEDPVKTYPANAPASLQAVVSLYVNDIIYPTYKSLANNAERLSDNCTALYNAAENGSMTQAHIDAACEAFKDARRDWEQSEAFLYGAASDMDIDPHIDSWPLDQSQVKSVLTNDAMVRALKSGNAAKYVREQNSEFDTALGFHGMEFVLFRNGANRTVAALNANETMAGMTSVKGIDELAFLAAVAGDLRDKCYQLEYCWLGASATPSHALWLKNNCTDIPAEDLVSKKGNCYGDNMLATGDEGKSYWKTWQENANNILIAGCSNICNEVASQKLGQAYRVATKQGSDEDAGDYIESPYSKRSFQDYQDNIFSIKNTLYGTLDTSASSPVQNSLLNYMKAKGYDRTADLSAALNNAISALETAKKSGIAFVDNPGHQQVADAIAKIDALNTEIVKAGDWIAKQR